MPWHDDLDTHFRRALHHSFEIVNLEPEQNSVAVWFLVTIGNRPVMVFYFEAV